MIGKFTYPRRRRGLDPRTENLLWQLSALEPSPERRAYGALVSDDEMGRYRRGELTAAGERDLEWRLVTSDRALERFAELAPQAASEPSRAPWWVAAALAGLAVATALLLTPGPPATPTVASAVPPYAVTVYGLATRRASEPSHEVRPHSTVRIVAQPAVATDQPLAFLLYRAADDGALHRVSEAGRHLRVRRGAAVLVARASRLVGAEAGLHRLTLWIGPAGSAKQPATLAASSLETAAREAGASLHPIELRLLPDGDG